MGLLRTWQWCTWTVKGEIGDDGFRVVGKRGTWLSRQSKRGGQVVWDGGQKKGGALNAQG